MASNNEGKKIGGDEKTVVGLKTMASYGEGKKIDGEGDGMPVVGLKTMASYDEVKKIGGDGMPVVGKVQNPSPLPLHISTSQREAILDVEKAQNGNKSSSSSLCIQRIFCRINKAWIQNPVKMVVFSIWILCTFVSAALMIMVLTGMLNGALPKKSQRDDLFEVNNQILTVLFTLLCLYQQPTRIYHLTLLLRWKPEDAVKLRKSYCKNGTCKTNERVHMMVVVILLNLNCLAQYAICSLNWGFSRANRPGFAFGICIAVAVGTGVFAGIYKKLSPLGKDRDSKGDKETQVTDEESQVPVAACESGRKERR